MTSSLVGSEMCIRDSPKGGARRHPVQAKGANERPHFMLGSAEGLGVVTVSYTHLTLPTICSV
eukprot:4599045-Prorocentrum_lima.AAC.1